VAISIFVSAQIHNSFVQVRNGAQRTRALFFKHSARFPKPIGGLVIATPKGAKARKRQSAVLHRVSEVWRDDFLTDVALDNFDLLSTVSGLPSERHVSQESGIDDAP